MQDPGGGGGTAHLPLDWQIWGAVQGDEHTGTAQVPSAWHVWGAVQSLSLEHAVVDGEGERFFATTATTMTATSIMTPMRGGGSMLAAGGV
ncbi:MAG: hypothetical protein EBU23_11295 [Mycobacteriaceae bacterium]|nr:hypothetical protein [Mycobacteriaceae bacterium]NBQ43055.1 hypothetical protein [Mycobacteriaceae bacterium]